MNHKHRSLRRTWVVTRNVDGVVVSRIKIDECRCGARRDNSKPKAKYQ